MKKFIFLVFFVFVYLVSYSQDFDKGDPHTSVVFEPESFYICSDGDYTLVFEDQFDGNELDLNRWTYVNGIARDYTFQTQKAWHTFNNLHVDGGELKITAEEENLTNVHYTYWSPENGNSEGTTDFQYTTGEVSTRHRFKYGKYSALIKIPKGKGFWPAFWLFGNHLKYNEIDIFEFWNEWIGQTYNPAMESKNIHMTAHYDYDESNDGHERVTESYTKIFGRYSDDYYEYTLIWEEDQIQWFVNGHPIWEYNHYTDLDGKFACGIQGGLFYIRRDVYPNEAMSIVLNLAIQNNEGNEPNSSTGFPSSMHVKWVKYYQRKGDINSDRTINETSDLIKEEGIFNSVVGSIVTVDGIVDINNNSHAEIIANDKIVLRPGFSVTGTGTANMRIDQGLFSKTSNDLIDNRCKSFSDVEEISQKRSVFTCYPNPTRGQISVNVQNYDGKSFSYNVINQLGKIVVSKNDLNLDSFTIDLANNPNGVYLINVFNENGVSQSATISLNK